MPLKEIARELQGKAANLAVRMPISWINILAGPSVAVDGRTLDGRTQWLLQLLAHSGQPPIEQTTVIEARIGYDAFMLEMGGRPAPIGEMVDRTFDGPAGRLRVRIYRPAGTVARLLPAILYFHGVGWVMGSLEGYDLVCRYFCARAGCALVAVDYRLAPEHKFPAAVEDCLAAYRWLRAHGREIGVDQARVGVGGDSAGGNLSAVVSQLAKAEGLPVPTCQVLIYPATDFVLDTPSHRELEDGHIIPRDRILWYSQQYLRGEADKTDLRASPIRGDLRGQPPALVVTAGFDPLRDEGHAYAEALQKAGTDVVYREYPGQIHAFVSLTKAIPQGMACTLEIGAYLRQRLGQG